MALLLLNQYSFSLMCVSIWLSWPLPFLIQDNIHQFSTYFAGHSLLVYVAGSSSLPLPPIPHQPNPSVLNFGELTYEPCLMFIYIHVLSDLIALSFSLLQLHCFKYFLHTGNLKRRISSPKCLIKISTWMLSRHVKLHM